MLSKQNITLSSNILGSVFQFSPPCRASFSLLMPPNYFNLKKNYKQLQRSDAADPRPQPAPHSTHHVIAVSHFLISPLTLSLISVSARVRCSARGRPDGAAQRLQRALCAGEWGEGACVGHWGHSQRDAGQTKNAANLRLNYKNIFFRNLTL